MSWDAGIFHHTAPENQQGPSPALGSLAEIRAIVERIFPNANWESNHEVVLPSAYLRLRCISKRTTDARSRLNPFRDRSKDTPELKELERIAREISKMPISDDEQIGHITIEGRGGGDFVTALVSLCRAGNWSLLDFQSGEFVDLDNPLPAEETSHNFQQFVRKFRKRNS